MLYIVGLGLSDVEDVTIKGLNAIKASDKVYLEHYTSILGGGVEYVNKLEEYYGKKIILADRTMVEQNSDEIIESARDNTVSFLVVGDPFGATTHSDLVLRAVEKSIPYKVVHNASIMNAVGCCGLQLYNLGETVSFCFWSESENWKPKSYVPKICENRSRGLHTLCLLDIKVKEKSVENLIKGRDIYEPPRFMTVAQACDQMVQIIAEAENVDADDEETPSVEKELQSWIKQKRVLDENVICVGLARVGRDDQEIRVDTVKNLAEADLGGPLHSLIVAGKLHPMEIEFIKLFYKGDNFNSLVELHNKFFN